MAVYIVTGNLGSGKSLVAMGKMRDYLWRGRRVATNVNVHVEHLISGNHPSNILRVADHPTSEFLWNELGFGSDTKDESKFGMLLLDEVGTWLNSREWKGADRQRVIDWFIHSRKRRWDCYLICQSVNMIDKQVREAIGEHVVICRRLDRMGIPLIGWLINFIGLRATLPQIHIAHVRYCAGMSLNTAPTVATWMYQGRDLWGSYDTSQRFQADNDGCATLLSPYVYKWLAKPKGPGLWLIEVCKQRNWKRLERVIELFRTVTEQEKSYRFLQLWTEHGNALTTEPKQTFKAWHDSIQAAFKYRRATPARCTVAWFGRFGFAADRQTPECDVPRY